MKKFTAFVLALICGLVLTGCNNRSMNYIIENEPSMVGIVKDTKDNSILVENESGEYWVSLHAENKDSVTHFSIGDEVVVYYDGNMAEGYPMQINTVYAITLRTPADRAAEELGDLIPMVMVDGVLYLDTGEVSTKEREDGLFDGEITATVDQGKQPTENDQSNFGTGYGYQYGINGTIEIYINEKWGVFEAERTE